MKNENPDKIAEMVKEGKITGKSIEVKPENAPNAFYLVPSILLLVLLIALIALRKTKMSKKMKKLLGFMHILLVSIIGLLLLASFADKMMTGFSIKDKIDFPGLIKDMTASKDTAVLMFAISFFFVILTVVSFVLRRRNRR